MKAMILAAGPGTRLRPLTLRTPKALLLVNGQPLIFYSLRLLKKCGITEVLINLHHLGDLIKKEVGRGEKFGITISYSEELNILGTGGGIKKGSPFFEGKPFIILNSDILIDVNLKKLIAFHKKKKGIATMVVRPRESTSFETSIWLGRGDRIVGIGEEAKGNKNGPMTFTGVQILEPRFLDYLPERGESCLVRDGYQPVLASVEKIYGYRYEAYWNDLGTLERYRQTEEDFKEDKIRLSFIDNC